MLAVYANAHLQGGLRVATLLALLCSAGGDVMLSLTFRNHFIAGLGSFLVAQVVYAGIFLRVVNPEKLKFKLPISLVAIGYAAFMAGEILPDDPVMQSAVVSYLVVITTMALAATWSWRASPLHMLGAFTFVASDSIIAWNMFASPVPYASFLIMSTYYAAQWLIALSV